MMKFILPDMNVIDAPWVTETLEEKFDNSISILHKDCILFGGAVRDVLANIEIGGDLDVGIPNKIYPNVCNMFARSERWVEKNPEKPKIGDYANLGKTVVAGMSTYVDISGEEVQLIQSRPLKENIHGPFSLPMLVDIVCCGVAVDMSGTVYEVVPGAYDDCRNHTLNINKNLPPNTPTLKNLKNRISKLVSRGWKNEI